MWHKPRFDNAQTHTHAHSLTGCQNIDIGDLALRSTVQWFALASGFDGFS